MVGLGLWNFVPATMLVEGAMFLTGIWLYARGTSARDLTGRYACWLLAGFLILVYLGNIFGSPPPSVAVIGIVGLAGTGLLLAWAAWADAHRTAL